MARRIGVFLLHGPRRLVVVADIAHDLSLEVGDRSEYAPSDDVALDLAEPQLDLVEPGRVRGSEVQTNLRGRFEEVFDGLALVSGEVVGDDMDLFAAGLMVHNVSEESAGVRGGVPLCG